MKQLSTSVLTGLSPSARLEIPGENIFGLPEKVLQFGTGVLLRALPDYFIDKANKQGIFNGRVVVVKSTDGPAGEFAAQDGLYTICVRGIQEGQLVEENSINASVSRVLSAKTEWKEILACAHNPAMQVIISNTTEVGIQLVEDSIQAAPPVSFPGKLLAFLYERYRAFNGSANSGMVIVPTELITDNGDKLESITLELAHRNNLEFGFIEWLENHNTFCNSLVDRIVPGKPNSAELHKLEHALGYSDALLTMSEVFRLWAIEGDEKVAAVLSFAAADAGVVIAPDITRFKELKLRLLNGTHSFNCGLAYLAGFNLTREAVTDPVFSVFAKALMLEEIAPAIPYVIDTATKETFAHNVYERFCNPFIDHQWLSITVQYTSKMIMRNIPLLLRHYELHHTPPMHMATGFAGFLLFMDSVLEENGTYYGDRNGQRYEIKDDAAPYFYKLWLSKDAAALVHAVLSDSKTWGTDLTALPGWETAVREQLEQLMTQGVLETIARLDTKQVTVS